MIELPGHTSTGCANCMSINHQTQTCPLEGDTMPRDQYTGLRRDLYDDLTAILRNYGYDDEKAHTIMETLEDE